MVKRIVGLVIAVGVIYLLYVGYVRYRDSHDESGEIHGDTSSFSASNDGSDSTLETKPRPAVVQPTQPVVQSTVTAPATDSIAPNPTNGMTYAGSGKFQVYRQGNLTWRVDTTSGQACILFATMEEWKKPIVYSNGCNAS